MIEIKVPAVGESINEVTLLKWVKNDGDYVDRDEVIAELESEKATFEVNAEMAGTLKTIAKENDTLKIGDAIATIDETAVKSAPAENQPVQKTAEEATAPKENPAPEKAETVPEKTGSNEIKNDVNTTPEIPPAITVLQPETQQQQVKASPVASRIIADKHIDPSSIPATGARGRIMKTDVLEALAHPGKKAFEGQELFSRNTRNEKMSNLRKTISRRLVEAKNTSAMLTTFNEVDMSRIMEIRKMYKDTFKEQHGVGLGFMSFFAKASAIALSEWPAVNAFIDVDELIYHDYVDISIAVSTPRGLTVPVIRNIESLSMAEIEKKVVEVAAKARDNKLTMEELQGGTFTITNGGVFGSLMSTPIINMPQSAILGMHKIQERAMVINGAIVIKPMMYLAVSYDHRVIDGRESVGFLVRIKELLENPELLLFGKDPVKSLLEL
ncbi:MAG: 2-oxoglutarate dehydrogenase complex dihydrolipoyllysine-residue succinyltransferase [Chitinophagaceae bacterium]